MSKLERTKVGDFTIEQAIDLETLKTLSNEEIESKYFIDIETAFKTYGAITLKTDNELKLFINGMMLVRKRDNDVYRIYDKDNNFIGLGVIQNNILKRDIVL